MPQLSYSQLAIPAQPGMLFDQELSQHDTVSRVCAVNIPFGVYCELNSSGQAVPLQDANFAAASAFHVTATSAAVTWTGAISVPAGQGVVFSSQPGVVYYFTGAISSATSGTLTVVYGGTTSTTATMAASPYAPQSLGISIFDPLGSEMNYTTWSVPTTLSGTVSVTNGSASITFSTNQTLAAGTQVQFASQPGVIYQLAAAISAGTAGTLVTNYSGTTAGSTTTTLPNLGTTAVGWLKGQVAPFLRKGRIWGANDNGGTAVRTGPINVWHSSTGASAQGVFTQSAVSQTIGSEIDVAPGVTVWNPDLIAQQYVDPFGNAFTVSAVEINI